MMCHSQGFARRLAAALLFGFASFCHGQEADQQIETLISRMTLDEKVGQLSLYTPTNALIANPSAHVQSAAQQREELRAGRITGLFNMAGQTAKREAQTLAVRESRLGIPLLFAADVIHGFKTVFPVPLAEAASWDPALAERTARAAAREATADGFRWNFAPMVDIARDARWGRSVEGAGEDVLLGRLFAAARVRGFQGGDLRRADAMLATAKHFAAYGAAEGGLDYAGADISERTLREVYLPPFKAAIDAGGGAVMTALNEIGGIPSTENRALLTGVLRDRWHFGGIVVSDYTADAELMAHGTAADERDAVKRAFLAGTDVCMQSGLYAKHLPALVVSGEVPLARLDEAVRRVLMAKKSLGLFEQPFRGLDLSADAAAYSPVAHRVLAREAAQRSIVLLKNDRSLLPLLRRGQHIALIGPFAGSDNLFGPWTLFGRAEPPPIGLAQGLREALADPALLEVVAGSGIQAPLPNGIAEAQEAARRADVVVLTLGESQQMSGEARSRASIGIPPAQQALAEAVARSGKPLVVLLRNGRALALEGAVRDAQALVVTWFLGSETGHAIADVLFGDVSPSGRLPVSFPRSGGQLPYYYAHKSTGRPISIDDPRADYRTRYLETRNEALYPFGHGLGYSPVHYDDVELSTSQLPWDGTLHVRVQVSNLGTRDIDETVQLYVRQRRASVTRPVRELKAFSRLHVSAGGKAEAVLELARADLSFVGPSLSSAAEPGWFDLWVGPSSAQGMHRSFELLPP